MPSLSRAGLSPNREAHIGERLTQPEVDQRFRRHPGRHMVIRPAKNSSGDERAQSPDRRHEADAPHDQAARHRGAGARDGLVTPIRASTTGRSGRGSGWGRRSDHREHIAHEERTAQGEHQPGQKIFAEEHRDQCGGGEIEFHPRTGGAPQASRPLRAALSKRVYGPRNTNLRVPIGPERCLATMTSAMPLSEVSGW